MSNICPIFLRATSVCAFVVLCVGSGCRTVTHQENSTATQVVMPAGGCLPRELAKTVLPTYTIEPPDILVIDATHIVPLHPYHLKTMDVLGIEVMGTLPDAPISGTYPIEPGGFVKLGFQYGSVKVTGLTVDEARIAVEQHLKQDFLKEPYVSVSLLQMAGTQQIAGEHMVGPDGTVTLGSYGSVSVVGHTLAGAKMVIQMHLSQFLENPEVSVDIYAYNSKVYYIITQGAGMGDGVYRFPITGNETVLDAVSQINGLTGVSSKRMWIARPSPQPGHVQVLPVQWEAITAQAAAETNYQILPGDRLFIAEDKLIAFDTTLGKIIAPIERIMGFTLLGTGTVTRLSGPVLKGGGNRQSNF